MTVTPQGTIKLCQTFLEQDYNNLLDFSNSDEQMNYFNSTVKKSYNDYYYMKKDSTITVEENIDNIIKCNYLFYTNVGFTTKTYFCFITNMEYINENATRITFKTDVYQTWLFDFNFQDSFVEREHVNDDTIGLHTVPENLETGEYIVNSSDYYNGLDNLKYVIQCTEWSTTDADKPLATNYGGIYMAGGAYICSSIGEVVNILQGFASRGKSDAVYNLYMIPASMITNTSSSLQYSGQDSPNTDTKTITKMNTINGYTPFNKKLLTFPFNYMLISNNNGSSNILHYERFSGNTCNFTIKGVPSVGGSIKIVPTNYDSNLNSEEEGLIAGKLPTLNWSDDEYTNWLTQNSVNIALGVASSGLTIVGGLGMMATGGGAVAGASAVVSGAMSIANELGAIYQHSLQPNSAKGNVNCGDINVCDHKNGFYFYKMSIKEEYARIIDNYFSMYGYKINLVKQPNLTGRQNWNYVKTINANITGDIPQNDIEILKSIFNNGTTIWHNASTFLDYSQSNNII